MILLPLSILLFISQSSCSDGNQDIDGVDCPNKEKVVEGTAMIEGENIWHQLELELNDSAYNWNQLGHEYNYFTNDCDSICESFTIPMEDVIDNGSHESTFGVSNVMTEEYHGKNSKTTSSESKVEQSRHREKLAQKCRSRLIFIINRYNGLCGKRETMERFTKKDKVFGALFLLFDGILGVLEKASSPESSVSFGGITITQQSVLEAKERMDEHREDTLSTLNGSRHDNIHVLRLIAGSANTDDKLKDDSVECIHQIARHLCAYAQAAFGEQKWCTFDEQGVLLVQGAPFTAMPRPKNMIENEDEQSESGPKTNPVDIPYNSLSGRRRLATFLGVLGAAMNPVINVRINDLASTVYIKAVQVHINLANELLRQFDDDDDDRQESIHGVTINRSSLMAGLQKAQEASVKDNLGTRNRDLHSRLCLLFTGVQLSWRSNGECIRLYSTFLYAHAILLFGQIRGIEVDMRGIVNVNGKSLLSVAEASRSETNFTAQGDPNEDDLCADSTFVDPPIAIESEATPRPKVQKAQVKTMCTPKNVLIKVLNLIASAMGRQDQLANRSVAHRAYSTAVVIFSDLLSRVDDIILDGTEMTIHNVSFTKESIEIAQKRVKDSSVDFSKIRNGHERLHHIITGVDDGAKRFVAESLQQCAIYLYALASLKYKTIFGLRLDDGGELVVQESFKFPSSQAYREYERSLKRNAKPKDDDDDLPAPVDPDTTTTTTHSTSSTSKSTEHDGSGKKKKRGSEDGDGAPKKRRKHK